jgi:hypothetical protein
MDLDILFWIIASLFFLFLVFSWLKGLKKIFK